MNKFFVMAVVMTFVGGGTVLASEEAPRDPIVRDHRDSPDPIVRDHRNDPDPIVRDHRLGPTREGERDPNEEVENHTVPARRGGPRGEHRPDTATDPSENAPLPVGLNAPSNLDTSDVAARTLTLHWMDNSTREWGVELYRMDPVAARETRVVDWQFIGNFEERRDSNVGSTGMRWDEDFDLTPETNYCYRLRAYVGFDKSEVSDYSGITCAFTAP